jgi:hypothetical protein
MVRIDYSTNFQKGLIASTITGNEDLKLLYNMVGELKHDFVVQKEDINELYDRNDKRNTFVTFKQTTRNFDYYYIYSIISFPNKKQQQ